MKQVKEIRYLPKIISDNLYIIETYDEAGLTDEQLHYMLEWPEIREKYISRDSYVAMPEGRTESRIESRAEIIKLYTVHVFLRTRGEWKDSTELWSTSYVNARSEREAIRKVYVPKGYDIGSASISFFAEAFEAHI